MMYKVLELCTNYQNYKVGGYLLSEMQKGAEGIGKKYRKQRERLEEYFDGIMVGSCKAHRIHIYQTTTCIGFTTHETQQWFNSSALSYF